MPQTAPEYDRASIADVLLERLDGATIAEAKRQFASSAQTRWFVIDDPAARGHGPGDPCSVSDDVRRAGAHDAARAQVRGGVDGLLSPSRIDTQRYVVFNHYFSEHSVGEQEYFRVTTFRGRPEQPLRDMVLRADSALRQGVRTLNPEGLARTTHLYERKQPPK